MRVSQETDIPVGRLVAGPITADEYADMPEWMEVLTDEVIGVEKAAA